ncbi:hypothetical protein BDM02DRAFT_3113521 [Thelephora ganbajun]|uniref:Uncharacterized protein n=1 Tax=Thelephora ganbajun TaxID=370292 RepID=A0ACB6ZJV2_THEGA|nr:hypothetical protein BDM02DRAFT_3113521 [Thelephora ganbajun]
MSERPSLSSWMPEPSSGSPLSPTSERSESASLPSSPTPSNNSPDPSSSPADEHPTDKHPADDEPQIIIVPSMPFLGIKPCPDELRACPSRYLVYGFPIPDEWFPHRYECLKGAGIEVDSYEDEYLMATDILKDACEEVRDEMWPKASGKVRIGTLPVWCLRDGKPSTCGLLRIGTYWMSPPFKVMMEMADRVVKYGIAEEPDWFPMYGMY